MGEGEDEYKKEKIFVLGLEWMKKIHARQVTPTNIHALA